MKKRRIIIPAAAVTAAAAGAAIALKRSMDKMYFVFGGKDEENGDKDGEAQSTDSDKSDAEHTEKIIDGDRYFGIDVDAIVGRKSDDNLYECIFHSLNRANKYTKRVMALMKKYAEDGELRETGMDRINSDLDKIQFVLGTIAVEVQDLYGGKYSGDKPPSFER